MSRCKSSIAVSIPKGLLGPKCGKLLCPYVRQTLTFRNTGSVIPVVFLLDSYLKAKNLPSSRTLGRKDLHTYGLEPKASLLGLDTRHQQTVEVPHVMPRISNATLFKNKFCGGSLLLGSQPIKVPTHGLPVLLVCPLGARV